mgnify:CR=1 FL=1
MATIKIIYRNKKLGNGGYPLFLRIAHLKAQATYIRLKGLEVGHENQFDKSLCRFTPKKSEYKNLNKILSDIETKADNIAVLLEVKGEFTYEKFKNQYLGIKENNCVITAYNTKIKSLYRLGKDGTALTYASSLKALTEFIGKRKITFDDITYSFLKSFEESRRIKGNAGNTISVHFRALRALHYDWCRLNDVSLPNSYIKFNIQRLSTKTAKRALTNVQFKRLINYDPVTNYEAIAKDIFMFSFFARGMNLMDIAGLKSVNIKDSTIIYKRSKTSTPFAISVSANIQNILNKYISNSKYLFPIIRKDLSFKKSVTNFTLTVNKQLKKIAAKIDLPDAISMYFARHTWATLAQKNGVAIEKISAGLGHTDLKTTQIYLSGFSNGELDSVTDDILNSL